MKVIVGTDTKGQIGDYIHIHSGYVQCMNFMHVAKIKGFFRRS